MLRASISRLAMILLTCALVLGAVGCGDDPPSTSHQDEARRAAATAGLPDDVAGFFALLGDTVTATYQVTYPATEGAGSVVISQSPPDRRVDVTDGRDIVESRITRQGTTYTCTPSKKEGSALTCTRTGSGGDIGGGLDPAALASATAQLQASAATYHLAVERRTVAGTKASCLVATAKADNPPTSGVDGTICISAQGVVLALERGDQAIEATGYTVEVPDGTFELPDRR